MKYYFSLFLLLASANVYSQTIENIDFNILDDNTVEITYDLVDCPLYKRYDMKIVALINNEGYYITKKCKGDLYNISCGKRHKVIWNALESKSEIIGDLQIEVSIAESHTIGFPSPSFVGFNVGLSLPIGKYTNKTLNVPSDNLELSSLRAELSLNVMLGYSMGFTFMIQYSMTNNYGNTTSDDTVWENYSLLAGPLISFPGKGKTYLYFRPMIGYTKTWVGATNDLSVYFNNWESDINKGAFTTALGTTLVFGKFSIGMDYNHFNTKFDNGEYRNMRTLSFTLGLAL